MAANGTANGKPRLPAAERRAQLLDVAVETFSKQGYADTSMNDIAEAAGVTKPVLYQHFASKRELFLELLRDLGGRLGDELAAAMAEAGSPRRQVEQGMRAYFNWVADHRDGFDLLFADTRSEPEFVHEATRLANAIAGNVAAAIVVDGLDEDRRRLLAFGVVGLAERVSRQWLRGGVDLGPEELATLVADLAWGGLRGLRAG